MIVTGVKLGDIIITNDSIFQVRDKYTLISANKTLYIFECFDFIRNKIFRLNGEKMKKLSDEIIENYCT